MLPKILLVEDEPSIAENIVYALKTEGFEVVWHQTAAEGLSAFEAGAFRLVILDVGLPDANGFELCKQVRTSSSVPIIFVTARKDEIDRVVGLEIGGDDYVVKPFSPRELSARVKAILRRANSNGHVADNGPEIAGRSGSAQAAAVGPFTIDEDKLEIRYHGHALTLSRYEYRILRVMLERPGKVFSRDQLMELAWDEPGSALDRTVDAHIKTLRAKLHLVEPECDPIRTYRGVGYAVQVE